MLQGIRALFQRAWRDTHQSLGGWPTYIAVIVLPAIGLGFHFLLAGYGPMSDEAYIWVIYMLAPLGLAFLVVFGVNLLGARYRIERDAHEVTKKKLADIPQGPQLPPIVYDTEWAKGIPTMSIRDVACALAGITREGYAASARAQALAVDLAEATYDGWVCSQEAHMHLIEKMGQVEMRVEGKPQFPGIEEATIETRIYTPSLREDYLLKRPDLNADWIPEPTEGNPMIVTMGVRSPQ